MTPAARAKIAALSTDELLEALRLREPVLKYLVVACVWQCELEDGEYVIATGDTPHEALQDAWDAVQTAAPLYTAGGDVVDEFPF
jgi:hypothetical protein